MAKVKGDFGNGSVVGHIFKLAMPIMAAEVVHVAYNIVDRVFLGHIPGEGTSALTGVGIAFPLITLIGAFGNLIASSAAPLATLSRGEGDNDRAQRILDTAFTMLLIMGLVITAVLYVSAPQLLRLFGGDDSTLPYALTYFRIYVIGTIPVLISMGMNTSITAQGFAGVGMVTVIIGAALNIILDPIFIFTLNMGVAGAAWATIISQAVSAIWIVVFLCSSKPILRISGLKLHAKEAKDIVRLGITGFCFRATNSITQAVVNITLKTYGGLETALFIGAVSIINSIREVAMIPINGCANGFQPVLSFNYGAKLHKRVVECFRITLVFVLTMNMFIYAVLMLATRPLAGIFSEDAALIETTVHCARIFYSAYFMMTFQVLGQNTFVALNMPKYALFFSLLRKIVVVVPLTLILPNFFGVNGVFYAEVFSQILCAVLCFTTMYIRVWRPIAAQAKEQI